MRFIKHGKSYLASGDMRHDYQNTHQVNTSEIQMLGEFGLDARWKLSWPVLRQLRARCGGRYVGNFAASYSEHGEQWSVTWLGDRICVFLVGNWAPGLQTRRKGKRKGAGCQKTRTAKRQERNIGQRQVILWYGDLRLWENVRRGEWELQSMPWLCVVKPSACLHVEYRERVGVR